MTTLFDTLAKLIAFESVTPHDAGCQAFMINFLQECGFECQPLNKEPVANFFARFGQTRPLLVFAGHTDVVPIGDGAKWETPPFQLTEKNGLLYGRGVADMKGSLAAMLHAAAQFVEDFPDFSGSLGFLITSGEEGDHFDLGTPYVMQQLATQGIKVDYCIVGEPSSTKVVGDVVKIGRRGSLSAHVIVQGKQGHVAYPHLAMNPIHLLAPALAELTAIKWDEGNDYFPPTTLQVTSVQSGGQASNIIPGELKMQFNIRYSTEQTAKSLQEQVNACFQRHDLSPIIEWRINGEPFLTQQGELLNACIAAITRQTEKPPELSTSGGTSDGRFIAPYGVEVIELGPVNASIHQVNELVSLQELEKLESIYYNICKHLIL